jgi:hypothetical protein
MRAAAADVPAATRAPPTPEDGATEGTPASAQELPAAPAAEGMASASDDPAKLATWRAAWACCGYEAVWGPWPLCA